MTNNKIKMTNDEVLYLVESAIDVGFNLDQLIHMIRQGSKKEECVDVLWETMKKALKAIK